MPQAYKQEGILDNMEGLLIAYQEVLSMPLANIHKCRLA